MSGLAHLASRGLQTALAAAVLAGSASAPGCMTPTQNRQDALVRITHEYNDGIRWGRYQDVTRHLAADEAKRFVARTGALDGDFEMADYEINAINFTDGGTRAEVTVDFTWYNQRLALVRKTVVGQDWRFSDGRWVCVSQRRLRGDRFPLIPEPIAEVPAPKAP